MNVLRPKLTWLLDDTVDFAPSFLSEFSELIFLSQEDGSTEGPALPAVGPETGFLV